MRVVKAKSRVVGRGATLMRASSDADVENHQRASKRMREVSRIRKRIVTGGGRGRDRRRTEEDGSSTLYKTRRTTDRKKKNE